MVILYFPSIYTLSIHRGSFNSPLQLIRAGQQSSITVERRAVQRNRKQAGAYGSLGAVAYLRPSNSLATGSVDTRFTVPDSLAIQPRLETLQPTASKGYDQRLATSMQRWKRR